MAQAPAQTPSAQPKSKSAKIWRRTRVGGGIALGVVLILWAASALGSALPLLAVALAVLAVCIWEVSRMGSFAGRKYGRVLGLAAVPVALFAAFSLQTDPGETPRTAEEFCRSALFAMAWPALVMLLATFAFVRVSSWFVRAAALMCVINSFAPLDRPEWFGFVGLVLFFFLLARLVLFAGRALHMETLAVVVLGSALVVSLPGLAVVWAAFGHWGLVALLAIAKVGDAAGYYVGSTLGRHKPFKSISPNKTIEGCVGSLIGSALAGVGAVALGWLPSEPHGLLGGALAGALVNLAAQASDLLESWVKRKAGVKDSGTWFATSGGMLDLVDSFFLATPVALIAWPLIFDFAPLYVLGE